MPQTALPPLDRVDPIQAWKPLEPDAKEPWDLKRAGHLFRRAAFGASLDRLNEAVNQGLPATLNRLFRGEKPENDNFETTRAQYGTAAAGNQDEPFQLRGWWVYWMLNGTHPLREKLTLFWHNHFATSIVKVRRPLLMYRQNELLYRHALGKFGPMLLAISKDPAMLLWLDSNSNVKGKPNENYARELMELFSLGVGHYTETDIREAARAFTGWHTENDKFSFNDSLHDGEEKNVLGQRGAWDGADIVRIVLEQQAAPRFLVRKLYRFYVSETQSPPDALLQPLADQFRKSDYDIAALVRTILHSRHFFSAYAYRQRIKSPTEYCLGAAQALGRAEDGRMLVQPKLLVSELDAMGQQLFAPPNVKGWEGGKSWLNTSTVVARHNFAQTLASGSSPVNRDDDEPSRVAPNGLDPTALVRKAKLTEPKEIVARFVDILLQGDIPEASRTRLVSYLADGKPEGKALDQRIRETVHAIMCLPEYQLA